MGAHTMKERIYKLPLLAGVLLVLCMVLLASSAALAEDPLQVEREISPRSLTGPTTVNVAINIINISDDPSPVTVTLYDPSGNVCSGFGSGGTANLSPGASAAYSGSWTVSESDLTAGRITYQARYRVTNSDGSTSSVSKPIALNFTYEDVNPSIHVQRRAPDGKVPEGTSTEVAYIVNNTGTVEVVNIVITDPGIGSEPLTIDSLPVGETREVKYEFVMGSEPVTSKPTITWEYMVGNTKHQGEAKVGSEKVIEVGTVNLLVSLQANSLIVNAGDKVTLTCTLENRGDENYEQIEIYDDLLGNVESGLSLAAGSSQTIEREITVPEAVTYCFKVSAVTGAGETAVFQSNNLTIQTLEGVAMSTDDGVVATGAAANIEIIIEADRQVIYEKPSDIIFQIKVINRGEAAVENVEIRAASKLVTTIDRLEAGEEYDFTRQFRASMEGEYQFSATVTDAAGQDQVFTSNTYPVTYHILSTPTPTAPPTAPPTEPPTAEPTVSETPPFGITDTQDEGVGAGRILLYILAGLLLLILLAVALLFVLDRRRGAPPPMGGSRRGGNVVIDSIQRSQHRDYARAPKRAPPAKREPQAPRRKEIMPSYGPDEDEQAQDDVPMYEEERGSNAPRRGYAAYDDYDVDMTDTAPQMRIHDVEPRRKAQPAEDADVSPFRRPPELSQEPSETFEKTEVYKSDFLERVREAETRQSQPETPAPAPQPEKETMSEEDAALLSGSTGMYRLSRRTASVRPGRQNQPSVQETAEDPEAFARRQRSSRARKTDLSGFYDDDEEGGADDGTRRLRRK